MPTRAPDLALVPGVRVGHATSDDRSSGVTCVRFRRPAPTVVDVRGGASATYDTASLAPEATFGRRWAIFLAGGSVFGLDAARGVRTEVLAAGGGHRAFRNPNRIAPISGAALFDLPREKARLPDYEALGARAARRARRGPVPIGRVGAGAGATVGKYLGRGRAMHGGVGSSAGRLAGGGTVGVLVVVNAVGAVRDPETGAWVAGARTARGEVAPPSAPGGWSARTRGTTLTVVATDLPLDRSGLARVAAIVHTGIARAIVPYHTATDGDVVFVSTTAPDPGRAPGGRPGAAADRIGTLAADRSVAAVVAAARRANPPGPRPGEK